MQERGFLYNARMVNNLATEKSLLAKLMAQENITVQHLNVKTASFSMKDRILTCPIWEDMSGVIYDLLMGHEVGHALYTPAEGWHDALLDSVNAKSLKDIKGIKDIRTFKKFKGFLNTVEDARIEKKIKVKYPGLRKSFTEAYKVLLSRDFFGIADLKGDTSKLNLIDRINLYFKVGSQLVIQFTDVERPMVNEVAACETWEDVVRVTQKIWEYVKEHEKNKINNEEELQDLVDAIKEAMKSMPPPTPGDGEEGDDGMSETTESEDESSTSDGESQTGDETDEEGEEGSGKSGEGEDEGEDDKSDPEGSGEGEDESDDATETAKGASDEEGDEDGDKKPTPAGKNGEEGAKGGTDSGKSEDESDEDPESITDNAFRDKEGALVDEQAKPHIFLEIPDCDLKKTIVPNKMMVARFELEVRKAMKQHSNMLSYDLVASQLLARFHHNNIKYIGLLVKEFEMRKNASQYSRQLQSKTGELDTRRLSQYRHTNDIFRKITEVPKGKNHGMIMFVDLSISMQDIIRNTMEQALVLTTFCKKIGIPFEVYGFSDSDTKYGTQTYNCKKFMARTPASFELMSSQFHLKSLISSDLSPREFKRASAMMLVFGTCCGYRYAADEETSKITNGFVLAGNIGNIHLSGTPFIETLVASKPLIKNFKNKTHVDIVNVIYLTDGEGGNSVVFPEMFYDYMYGSHRNNGFHVGFRDPDSKISVMDIGGHYQSTITTLMRQVTGARHIGYYVGTSNYIFAKLRGFVDTVGKKNVQQGAILDKELRDSLSDDGYFAFPSLGYDDYFYIPVKDSAVKDDQMVVRKNAPKGELLAAFVENQNKKHSNRAMCARFAKLIAA